MATSRLFKIAIGVVFFQLLFFIVLSLVLHAAVYVDLSVQYVDHLVDPTTGVLGANALVVRQMWVMPLFRPRNMCRSISFAAIILGVVGAGFIVSEVTGLIPRTRMFVFTLVAIIAFFVLLKGNAHISDR